MEEEGASIPGGEPVVEVDEAVVHVHVLVQGGHQVPGWVRCQVTGVLPGARAKVPGALAKVPT